MGRKPKLTHLKKKKIEVDEDEQRKWWGDGAGLFVYKISTIIHDKFEVSTLNPISSFTHVVRK